MFGDGGEDVVACLFVCLFVSRRGGGGDRNEKRREGGRGGGGGGVDREEKLGNERRKSEGVKVKLRWG